MPQLPRIPSSTKTVDVSVMDTTSWIRNIKPSAFMEPSYPGHDKLDVPAYSFLIEHEEIDGKRTKLLFDLGIKRDWENLPGPMVKRLKGLGWEITIEKNVSEILEEHGQALEDIEAIIWSHHHFDHTGDPSLFPDKTKLIVGPGFKQHLLPGFPSNEKSTMLESQYKGKEIVELDFQNDSCKLQLGRFEAIDFFEDGSLYLLDAPGHALGHVCALARTTPNTFIFMGADTCHHGGEWRPSALRPLPDQIQPDPRQSKSSVPCPGSLYTHLHRHQRDDEAFYDIPSAPGVAYNIEQTRETISKLQDFDAMDNVFTLVAHDPTAIGVVDLYPKKANGWKAKAWAEETRWKFLGDFKVSNEKAANL